MNDLLTLPELATTLKMPLRYLRDRIVKRPDFPRAIVITRQLRYWKKPEVADWLDRQQAATVGRGRG